jgi:flagellar motor switch protein FliN
VIELDRAAGSPVDVLVNGALVWHGEVVVVDEEFGIRVAEIVVGEN